MQTAKNAFSRRKKRKKHCSHRKMHFHADKCTFLPRGISDLFLCRFREGISFPNFVKRSTLKLPLSKLCAVPFALQNRALFEGERKAERCLEKGRKRGGQQKGQKGKKNAKKQVRYCRKVRETAGRIQGSRIQNASILSQEVWGSPGVRSASVRGVLTLAALPVHALQVLCMSFLHSNETPV